MFVIKRDGRHQEIDLNKITHRIKLLINGDNYNIEKLKIEAIDVAKHVCSILADGISTEKLDEFAAEICAYKIGDHIDYGKLASRLIISNHHKKTYENFSDTIESLYHNVDSYGRINKLVNDKLYNNMLKHKKELDEAVNKNQHFDYKILDYFGMKTLQKSYLIKSNKTQERYQHLLMRQALTFYEDNLSKVLKCYDSLSRVLYTHATPTMYNSGTNLQQLSSCFLLGVGDSINSMYNCTKDCAIISKCSGGIGLHISDIRANQSQICGTNGYSKGIIDYIRVINNLVRHVDQGGGKRNGAIALYIEPWHADIEAFLQAKLANGIEDARARDLFYGLWIPDIFMRRVDEALKLKSLGQYNKSDSDILWSLMCPKKCPGLTDLYGEEFEELYIKYEKEGKYNKQINILIIWDMILTAQKETGTPYMCYKDSINKKSQQKNIGIIKSSNLCAEIVEYSDEHEYGTCNLASINLKMMIKSTPNKVVDYELLFDVAKEVTRNLNNIIDINKYPVIQTANSNFRHRPIGVGVQGLADLFILLGIPFESSEAQEINKRIFETIYYGCMTASCDLAEERTKQFMDVPKKVLEDLIKNAIKYEYLNEIYRKLKDDERESDFMQYNEMVNIKLLISDTINSYNLPRYTKEYKYMSTKYPGAYSTFEGSPLYNGFMQQDLWDVSPSDNWKYYIDELKLKINKYGVRNSLLVALMPTASTAHILRNIECMEPLNSNMYTRQTIAGNFIVINHYLQQSLTDLGLWNKELKDKILSSNGSISLIQEIPEDIRKLYKTVWEMKKKTLIAMSADRGPWVDQTQSFNLFISNPDSKILQTIHLDTWKSGLKTGMYYLRRKTEVNPQQFTVDIDKILVQSNSPNKSPSKSNESSLECTMCSS